jgi:pimeloyl-ACP methyl ester carboxylesterase
VRPLRAGLKTVGSILETRRHAQQAGTDSLDHADRMASLGAAGQPVTVVSADGTALHTEVFGPGDAPTIVLAHGWLCTSAVWHHQVRALSEHHRVVVYDQRGHGRSHPATGGDYSADALAADLDAVLDQAVAHGERVVVAGHSMGAMAVVAWAAAHCHEAGERLAGVTLVNVGVEDLIRRSTLVPFPAALTTLRSVIGERILAAPLVLPPRTNPVLSRLVKAIALGRGASQAQVALCTEMFLATPTDVRASFGATLSTFDLAHGLPALTAPTVVVAGQHDRLTPSVHARAIAAALACATLIELPAVGHMAPIEAAAEVSHAILAPGRGG